MCSHSGSALWRTYYSIYCIECGKTKVFMNLIAQPGFREVGAVATDEEIGYF